jgi:hypothetical protein
MGIADSIEARNGHDRLVYIRQCARPNDKGDSAKIQDVPTSRRYTYRVARIRVLVVDDLALCREGLRATS